MQKKRRRLLYLVLAILAVAGASLFFYFTPYEHDERARAALENENVTNYKDWIVFQSRQQDALPSIIFYPGGLVKPEAYAPLALSLADKGHTTYIVKMPLHLAVLGGQKGKALLNQFPESTFFIGGHSLGGVMASRFAADNQNSIEGVFFLASYPDEEGSLVNANMPALSITGSMDGVLNTEAYQAAASYLPTDASYPVISGGNHSQFGSYGQQKGDLKAEIPPEEQTEVTAELVSDWIKKAFLQPQ
ncbi:alpha/beta hydrolase [Bacillus lacus]|uniref:Alpha/beta hydrolase n=1 Tax=Metabacillus lacus TaxID=1983721 RepID=A0A7X2IYJ0_9BACI|nr:alpha/beta hydrolase [Metabacillus lacus]